MARPRIFVSSTCYDLKHIRASLEGFISDMGYDSILSEKGDIPYSSDRPLDESCYREVGTCDIFVMILGGQYGSEKSQTRTGGEKTFFDLYDSVTKEEYKAAISKDIPIYILVEKSVYSDYETYLKNPTLKIDYPHVNSINTLKLIDDILKQPLNNPLHKFERYSEIEEWLKVQWAGQFQNLLRQKSDQARLASLESQVRQLSVLNETLKNYLEKLVTSSDPTGSKDFIAKEEDLLQEKLKHQAFGTSQFIDHLVRVHKVPLDFLLETFTKEEFLGSLMAKITQKLQEQGEKCPRFMHRDPSIISDILQSRNRLGLKPLIVDDVISMDGPFDDSNLKRKARKNTPKEENGE